MNKKKGSEGKKNKKIMILLAVIIILAAMGAVIFALRNADAEKKDDGQSDAQDKTGITFPYELEDGKLVITSLFQYDGMNPDCDNEEGESIAALEIENQSEEFCESVEVRAVMADGRELLFKAADIPAGRKVWVYEADNQSADQEDACDVIEGDARFGTASMMEGKVAVSVDDTVVTIQNLTEEEITGLSVGCHCVFEDAYFGGLTYQYPVGALPAQGTVTVDAADCYLGTAEVVRITEE